MEHGPDVAVPKKPWEHTQAETEVAPGRVAELACGQTVQVEELPSGEYVPEGHGWHPSAGPTIPCPAGQCVSKSLGHDPAEDASASTLKVTV